MEFLIIFIAGLAAGVHFTKKYQFNNYAVHIGEQIVTDVLELSLSEEIYALLSNVTLPIIDDNNQKGTSQVDHILICTRGVFVIETKHYRGSIVGTYNSKEWYQYTQFDKHSLQNPLLQNFSHLMAIESITGFSHHDMHNVVSFSGNAEFKSERPKGVLKSSELKAFIDSFPNNSLSADEIYYLVGQLQVHRLPENSETDRKHVKYLTSKHKKKTV